ncbi:hypothetical protein CPB83DRAFT_858582 [Crepidotus variabilis]|uniref:Uncharacterized protein n=1 Tax=Crepidotus variabilis TaxID=179855 RepID=A0A9P6EBV6_9AGAR|nr:hypothetical protein CPB83DRAFT_858582 [Crepidotus variabilis]
MPKNFAATRLVNLPGAEPKITAAQLWKALELKLKQPELFLPAATGASFASEGGKSIRSMNTKAGKVVKESYETYEGTMTYLDGVDGDFRVTNLISYDKNNELLLTFSFVGGIPVVAGLGENHTAEELNKIVGDVLEKTIDVSRDLVKKGVL